MFDNLFSGQEEQPTGVDALLKLLDKEDIDLKTDVEILQIRTLFKSRLAKNLESNEFKTVEDAWENALEYYKELKASYKRKGRGEVVKGVTEMRTEMLQAQLMKDQEVVK